MSSQPQSQTRKTARKRRKHPFHVLLLDGDEAVFEQVRKNIEGRRDWAPALYQVESVTEARNVLLDEEIDLVIVNPAADPKSLEFIKTVGTRGNTDLRVTQVIVLADKPTLDDTVVFMRAGATDLINRKDDPAKIADRIESALQQHRVELARRQKVKKLKRVCRKLNEARDEVTQQVDVLCSDLVTAYQELAEQMNTVVETSEYAAILRQELDLERLLHRTLEFVLEKAGATNAAIFLPVTADEYTLGGYVNYDCADGSPELLLNHMADVIAPRVAENEEITHLIDNESMTHWLGDDAAYLADSHLVGTGCWSDDEVLAVLVMFRDGAQPFSKDAIEIASAIAPLLGDYLARIIRVHHRCEVN